MSALKRAEYPKAIGEVEILNLRAENRELRRRVASIRYIIARASHDPDTMMVVRDLLDLRKPLLKAKGRR